MQESHGGNIYLLAEKLGLKESAIIDFSASTNPLGVPESVLVAIRENMKYLSNYPDPDAKRLRMKIAEHIGVSPNSIVCGNGSTELIYLIVRTLRPARVLIPAPTFSEYERACRKNCGITVVSYSLNKKNTFNVDPDELIHTMAGENSLSPQCDMMFLCNPNNPTGRLIKKEGMLKIADAAKRLACKLVVDEAFIDFCPDDSIIDEVRNNPYLIVLRSLTKFYGLSGLRVGYAVLSPLFLEAVKEAKEPWTVNTLAQISGVAALDDEAYKTKTFKVIEKEKKSLEEGFRRLGISYLPSAVNYYLLQSKKAQELITFLKEKGVLVRDCANFIGLDNSYIRVAVKSESDNRRLLEEISSCMA